MNQEQHPGAIKILTFNYLESGFSSGSLLNPLARRDTLVTRALVGLDGVGRKAIFWCDTDNVLHCRDDQGSVLSPDRGLSGYDADQVAIRMKEFRPYSDWRDGTESNRESMRLASEDAMSPEQRELLASLKANRSPIVEGGEIPLLHQQFHGIVHEVSKQAATLWALELARSKLPVSKFEKEADAAFAAVNEAFDTLGYGDRLSFRAEHSRNGHLTLFAASKHVSAPMPSAAIEAQIRREVFGELTVNEVNRPDLSSLEVVKSTAAFRDVAPHVVANAAPVAMPRLASVRALGAGLAPDHASSTPKASHYLLIVMDTAGVAFDDNQEPEIKAVFARAAERLRVGALLGGSSALLDSNGNAIGKFALAPAEVIERIGKIDNRMTMAIPVADVSTAKTPEGSNALALRVLEISSSWEATRVKDQLVNQSHELKDGAILSYSPGLRAHEFAPLPPEPSSYSTAPKLEM